MPRDAYQTVMEVADRMKVNEATVRQWIKEGSLRAIDIGKGWRIGPDDLDAFLEGHATRPSTRPNGDTNTAPEMNGAEKTKGQKN